VKIGCGVSQLSIFAPEPVALVDHLLEVLLYLLELGPQS
jgi:hypothetical protein